MFLRRCKPEEGLGNPVDNPCLEDGKDLLKLADRLSDLTPSPDYGLDGWREQLTTLLADPELESLSGEHRLEELSLEFRRIWGLVAHSTVNHQLKSPASGRNVTFPFSNSIQFVYERVLTPAHIERRLEKSLPTVSSWESRFSVFSSGMAAILTALKTLHYFRMSYRRADEKSLRLDWFGGYYETLKLILLLHTTDIYSHHVRRFNSVLERLRSGKTDILFLEPLLYDWTQTVADPMALIEALTDRPEDRPWILIIDSTLLGCEFDLELFLTACGSHRPVLALDIRSGLKLDQSGLEFSNVGLVKICTHQDLQQPRYPTAEQFHSRMEINRSILGTALSLDEMAVLDLPVLFHPMWTQNHSRKVFDNNRRLAFALEGIEGIFARVNHPGLGPNKHLNWAESPLVVLEFHRHEDQKEHHALLLQVIAQESQARNLIFYQGASFGFRHHRCEVVVSENTFPHKNGQLRGFFKIAAGSRRGPSLEGIILLLQELAAYPSFQALRQAYPQLG
ncbi:MAG: hypothetical protein HQL72_11550 [Magnetococcales bacterium]|nr:hypothetical protein [Magnetococcales bacterium]